MEKSNYRYVIVQRLQLKQSPMKSSSKGSAASVLWLLIFAFVFTQFLTPSKDETCKPIIQESRIQFMNDVVLEFDKYGFGNDTQHSRANRTNVTYTNRTRVVVNGIAQQLAELSQANVGNGNLNAEVHHSRHGHEIHSNDNFNIARGLKLGLLGCNEIDDKFYPFKDRGIHIRDGVSEIYGSLHHPVIGRTTCVLKKANIHDKAFRRLQAERRKRLLLGTDTRISYRMFGECNKSNELQIIVEHDETSTTLCDDIGEHEASSYTDSKCFKNEKLQNLIDKSSDKTRSAFVFLREMLCLFAEMEDKRFFVKDIHGKHLVVTSNFSVIYKNIDVLAYYGSRNILSDSTCKFDEDCPKPEGELWNNGSANRATYSRCLDANPSCSDNTCSGYNANLHICGICHWILQPLYHYFTRLKDRSRVTSIIMSTIQWWPHLRGSAMESCRKMTTFYEQFEEDMKAGKRNSRGFHSG